MSKKRYNIDDLFGSVNDIYGQWDEGKIERKEAYEILIRCCKQFIKSNEKDNTTT